MRHPPGPSLSSLVLLTLVAALGTARSAGAVDVSILVDAPEASCHDLDPATRVCSVDAPGEVDVVWSLDSQQLSNGYDLEIRWDPTALTLISATQLYPDTGTPGPFLEEPADPGNSSAVVLSVVGLQTTALFSLRFDVLPGGGEPGPDLSWFANGNGLAPAELVLLNPEGSDIYLGATPGVPLGPAWPLALTLAALGVAQLRPPTSRRRE
jgi:hypothetical protein